MLLLHLHLLGQTEALVLGKQDVLSGPRGKGFQLQTAAASKSNYYSCGSKIHLPRVLNVKRPSGPTSGIFGPHCFT